jgi:signal transduction histidine kinase
MLAALVCVALSTQFLFQATVHQDWPWGAMGSLWLENFWQAMLVSSAILAVLALAGAVPLRSRVARLAWFCLALLAGAYLGEWAVLWLQWGTWPSASMEAVFPRAFRWLPIAVVGAMILQGRQRAREVSDRLRSVELSGLEIEQQQAAMRLQVLQSQVEPHFLFNTLATIRRLHQTDLARGRETLSGFIRYLRATLPGLREPETTLGREIGLVRAYIDVLGVRMGERLRFDLDVAPELRDLAVPPFSVATLVENAVKHGLSRLPAGGTISIKAQVADAGLEVVVSDTGVGLTATSGSGTGLANLRTRLRSLYGNEGSLSLAVNTPSGLVATLRLPSRRLERARNRHAA